MGIEKHIETESVENWEMNYNRKGKQKRKSRREYEREWKRYDPIKWKTNGK